MELNLDQLKIIVDLILRSKITFSVNPEFFES